MSIQITDNINTILIINNGVQKYIPKDNTVVSEEEGGFISIYHSGHIELRASFTDITVPLLPDIETLCGTISGYICGCSGSVDLTAIETKLDTIISNTGKSYFVRMLEGDFPGTNGNLNSARRKPLTIGVEEVVWQDASSTYPFPDYTMPATLDIVSTNANDDGIAPLSGARVIAVVGLDGTGNIQFDAVTMNGLTPVSTVNQYIRVLTMFVGSAGATGLNEGNITASYMGNVIDLMVAGDGFSSKAAGSVPANYTLLINLKLIACDIEDNRSAPVTFRIYTRDIYSGVIQMANQYTTKSEIEITEFAVGGFHDVWITAQCDVLGANVGAEVMLKSILAPN